MINLLFIKELSYKLGVSRFIKNYVGKINIINQVILPIIAIIIGPTKENI